MARSLKTNGLQELAALEKRVNRQYSLGRIAKSDQESILVRIGDIRSIILKMSEKDEDGREVEEQWL